MLSKIGNNTDILRELLNAINNLPQESKVQVGVMLDDDGNQKIVINDSGGVINLASLTSDADAVEEDVTDGKIFYANGARKVGTAIPADPAPVLLWTNASPTSEFGNQDVILPTGYSAYIIEYRFSTSDASYGQTYFDFNGDDGALGVFSSAAVKYQALYMYSAGRMILGVEDGKISFGTGFYSAATSRAAGGSLGEYSNTYGIPTRIWGVKFTL